MKNRKPKSTGKNFNEDPLKEIIGNLIKGIYHREIMFPKWKRELFRKPNPKSKSPFKKKVN